MAEKFSLKNFLNDERIRAKGMIRFIFEIGIIRFAVPATILAEIIFYPLKHGWTAQNIGASLTGQNIIGFIGEVFFKGLIFGSIVWVWGKQEDYPKLNQ
jgi:hypothetical protein